MKRLTIIAALLLMAMPMMAERVTPETARKVATTFLNNNGAKAAQLTDLSKSAGFQNLYIFTADEGFVVMAADDCVQPILGYALDGFFPADDMPANVSSWLQGYNDEIQYAIDHQLEATAETVQLWKDLIEGNSKAARATIVVDPLIQTKWNQNKYYNDLCPAISSGPNGHAYTGCVATAMAQILKYWEYPSHGIGSHSYEWNNQTFSADFGATTYDWDNMNLYYNYYYDDNGTFQWLSTPTSVQIEAVATLMYHCGVSVNMKYRGSGGSSATTADVVYALKNYFNYSSNIAYKTKSDYEDEWISMVKAELDANRPLQYRGQDSGGGHSFVCDGYDSDDYFHFNWGWSGAYDGYFSLDNLDTGANNQSGQGNGVYTDNQAAIFGIQPSQCLASEPLNLTYTLTGLQDVILDWTAANGAVSYNIYHNNSYVGNSATNSYTETMPLGTNVYYVRSVDANGDLSLSSNPVTIIVEYPTPIVDDLEATLSGNNANLNWTAPEWCYPEMPSATLTYGTQTTNGYLFLWTNSMYWGHRHLAENISAYNGLRLYSVDFYVNNTGTYEVLLYEGTTTNYNTIPMTQVYSQSVSVTSTGWNNIDLTQPYYINGNQDLWVFIHNSDHYDIFFVYLCSAEGNEGVYLTQDPTWSTSNTSTGKAFLIKAHLTDGIYTYNLYQDGTQIAEDLNQTTYNATLSNNSTNLFTVKTNYYGGETEASNKIGFAKGNASIATLSLIDNDKMTITADSKLTVSGTLSDVDTSNLILENGAQLVNNSNGVKATVKKSINAYTQNGGWYLLASPILDSITPTVDNGLFANNHDLYTFDQSEEFEWRNYAAQSFDIGNKTGYLFANSGNPTLTFTGTLAANVNPTPLAYDVNASCKGFNLIGNPYPCNAYVDRSFYVLDSEGSNFTLGSGPIPPCAAILVQAQGNGEHVTFSKTASKNEPNITFSVVKADTKDNAILDKVRISFNEANQLAKYSMLGQGSRLYIPQNGQNLAVACAVEQREMPINFKAAHDGTYTLMFEKEDLELKSLHLIDNLTGDVIDLLAMPSYTFEAKTTDPVERFKIAIE